MTGIVYKSTGSWYQVKSEDGKFHQCRIKGKFRIKGIKSTNPVAVGDRVIFDLEKKGDEETGVIKKILDRENFIVRKSVNLSKQTHIIAANIDQVFLLITINNPPTFSTFIDRFLVAARAYRIDTVLVFNKIDSYAIEERAEVLYLKDIYEAIGYRCVEVSATQHKNVSIIKEIMKGKTSMFVGHSGVGKTTLVNAIDATLDLKTKEISENSIGSFSQMPLRLAWAITIHKSQGLTFDKAIIDANAAFAHGQTYVALSRCRTLGGIVLKNRIAAESIITDFRVTSFNNNVTENPPNQLDLTNSQKVFQLNMVGELMNYYQFMFPINRLIEIYNRNKNSFQGIIINPLMQIKEVGVQPILVIANSFNNQLNDLCKDVVLPENNTVVLDRIHKAITYFINHTKDKIKTPFETLTFSTEDKALQKDFDKNLNTIEEYINIKLYCLYGLNGSFTIKKLLKLKAEAVLLKSDQPKKHKEFELKVDVDQSLCIGCCSCETIAPGVFTIDKNTKTNPKSKVYNKNGAKNQKIITAAETCPTKAIIVDNLDENERIYPY